MLSSSAVPLRPGLWQYLATHLAPVLSAPLALTMLLFTGPLYVEYLEGTLPLPAWCYGARPKAQQQSALGKISAWLSSWWNTFGLRNFVVGPLTEEFIWRSCILPVTAFSTAGSLAPSKSPWVIFGTPLYFGIAHLHHARETYISRGKTKEAAQFACLQATVQLAYTTVFGWYANWLWLRTGNILAPFISHVFCNVMGLPNPWGAAKDHPSRHKGEMGTMANGILYVTTHATLECPWLPTQPSLALTSWALHYSLASSYH